MTRVYLISFCVFISLSQVIADTVTFQEVTVHGYEIFVPVFEKHIISSKSLKENIPDNISYDALKIIDSSIPILYEDSITDLENLDELVLTNDGITEIQQGTFKNLPSIRKIDLKHNNLKEVKTGVFNGLPVADLDLSENILENIDANAFDNLPNLLSINLAKNKLRNCLGDWFKENPSLIRISFHHNLLTTLPVGAFQNIGSDKRSNDAKSRLFLNFGDNLITVLPPGVFEGLSKIKYLWLDNNRIETIDEDVFNGVDIQNLLLNGNKISCISEDVYKTISAKLIGLDANPWNCTCLDQLKEWTKDADKTVATAYAEMECSVSKIGHKLDHMEQKLRPYHRAFRKWL